MAQIQDVITLLEQGDLIGANKLCQDLVSKNPTDAELVHLLGIILAKHGDLPKAIQCFKQAIAINPHDATYHNNISNAYKLILDADMAILHLNESLKLNPNRAESFNNLGSLYYLQGDITKAIVQFEKALRLNSKSIEAHYNLANCFVKQDMIKQAIDHYHMVLELNNNHTDAILNIAMSYLMLADYANSLPFLEIAASNNQNHADIQGHLAECYLNLGKSKLALAQYKKALNLSNDNPAWHHNLAVLYLRDGDSTNAKAHLQASLQLEPNNSTASHLLAALRQDGNTKSAPGEYVQMLFDQYAHYYDHHMNEVLAYSAPQKLREAINTQITSKTNQQYILDLGCGTGLCGIYFRDLARFLVGVDISSGMLQQANKLGAYDALCCCNIQDGIPGYGQEYFDIVLAADVFVYIGELEPVFATILSSLKKEGSLCFTIEELTNSTEDYQLQETGRFSHSVKYIEELCNKFKLKRIISEQITPREQNNDPILGVIYLLKKFN